MIRRTRTGTPPGRLGEPARERLSTVVMLACPSAAQVAGPTMPSGVRPWRRWKRLTARWVAGPKTPSTAMPRRRWSSRTRPRLVAPPLLVRRDVVRRECAARRSAAQVAALEGLDGAARALAEDAVGVDAEPALSRAHARALGALLERLRRGLSGRGRGDARGRRDAGHGQHERGEEQQRSQNPFVPSNVASVERLRGELT